MDKCKNYDNPEDCDAPKAPGSPLCHECRNAALCACRSGVKPRLNRSGDDGGVQLSNDVLRSCGGRTTD